MNPLCGVLSSTRFHRSLLSSMRVCLVLLMGLTFGTYSHADTGDVIDDFLAAATGVRWCVTPTGSQAGAVWADVDADGTYDTQLVFTTASGEASVYNEGAVTRGVFSVRS